MMDGLDHGHSMASMIYDVIVAGIAILWYWVLGFQVGLIAISPTVHAIGSVVLLFVICLRAWAALNDFIRRRAGGMTREERSRFKD